MHQMMRRALLAALLGLALALGGADWAAGASHAPQQVAGDPGGGTGGGGGG